MDEQEHAAVTLTNDNFEAEVSQFPGVVLVDFWAPWCGPCRAIAPAVEELAKKYAGNGQVKVGKLNIDENSELAQKFSVLSIPTLKVFAAGQPAGAPIVGVQPPPVLQKAIDDALRQLTPAAA